MTVIAKRLIRTVIIGSTTLIAVNYFLPPYHQEMMIEILIWTIFAISFDLLFGYTGLLSFGQCLFFGIGAYGAALSILRMNMPVIPAILFGMTCAGILAISVAPLIVKLQSHYFVILTVLIALIFLFLANNLSTYTGGDDGLPVPLPGQLFFGLSLGTTPFLFINYFVIVVSVIVFALCLLIVKSPFGLILKGIRDNPRRAEFLGYPIKKYQLVVWLVAGLVAGAAGSLYVLGFRYVSTSHLHWTLSGEGIVWTVIGGKGTLFGAALGVGSLLYLRDMLSHWVAAYPALIGLLLIFLVRSFPNGLLGLFHRGFIHEKLYRIVTPGMIPRGSHSGEWEKIVRDNRNESGDVLMIENLTKSFGGMRAVDRVSMSLGQKDARVCFFLKDNEHVQQHEISNEKGGMIPDFSIVGPNAAGKSTFFNLLTGLLTPDEGTITFRGDVILQKGEKKGRQSGMQPYQIARLGIARTFQHSSVFPKLTVYENLWLAAQTNNRKQRLFMPAECDDVVRSRVDQVLKLVHLEQEARQFAGTLSFGRQKMLELGLAIATDPDLLLLDEPTAGVSPREVDLILELIYSCRDRLGLLIIEHDIEIVKKLDFRTCVFGNGRIVFEGTPTEILGNEFVQEHFLGAVTT